MAKPWEKYQQGPWSKYQKPETSVLQSAANVAGDINYGITSAIPGLNYFTSKYLGIGEDIPRGDEGQPSVGQGALRMTGTAATFGVGMLAAPLRAMAQTSVVQAPVAGIKDAVKYFLDRTARVVTESPKTALAVETTSAAAAGAAGQAVFNETQNPSYRAGAEIVAGLATGGVVPLAKAASELSLVGAAARRAIHVLRRPEQVTQVSSGDMGAQRAAKRLREAVPDTEGYLARSRQDQDILDAPFSAAERAEEPGLMALERAVVNSSEELRLADQARFDTINQVIRREMTGVESKEFNPGEARVYLDNLLEERIRIAGTKLDESLSGLSPTASRGTANELARQALDDAYQDALGQEKDLWAAVPKTDRATTETTTQALQVRLAEVQEDRVKKATTLLPAVVRRFIGRTNKEGKFIPGTFSKQGASVQELQSLRSELLREIRAERALDAPDRHKISILSDLQESLLTDMTSAGDDDALRMALNFSADLNARFWQGDVGSILGYERTGEQAIPALLTLEKTLGKAGRAGATSKQAVNELMATVRDRGSPEMRLAMEDFLIDEFFLSSRLGNDFNPQQAARYLRSRKEVLELFPGLRSRMEAAVNSGNAKAVAEGMKKPSQSPAAVVLGAPPGKEMNRIIASSSPRAAAKDIVEKLATDRTGRALPAMRRAAIDWLMDQSASRSVLDTAEQPVIMGSKLKSAMDDRAVSEALGEILTKDQMARLRTIQNTALRRETAQRAAPADSVLNDVEGIVSELVRSVLAAGAGRNLARNFGMGGTVQIPGKFVTMSNRLRNAGFDPARKLIIDAVMSEDDKLLRSILVLPKDESGFLASQKQLNAWLYATAKEYGVSLAEDKESPSQDSP
jgi:hypothetical protein